MNRRSFLKGALAITAASIAPLKLAQQLVLPQIVGDGIHDDWAGLQAALNGQPFICDGCVIRNATEIVLRSGTYRLSRTLDVPPSSNLRGEGSARMQGHHRDPVLRMRGNCSLTNFYIEGGEIGIIVAQGNDENETTA